ncbi:hypothetical protein GCM10025868_25080 [Angustibacter aerolatus]|uniref:Urocanase N-terminal domain-containing protein n=1 Tax=Angustibacter aerolatus TaxID=1162965 RepID=A0ABQ6JIN6_9ACTN|nr:hypothetical protein GCM10025868_25080 [Angustibacter aerolatus]
MRDGDVLAAAQSGTDHQARLTQPPTSARPEETTMDGARPVRAPRGTTLTARRRQTEAPMRMLMNNLDPEVAERPDDLVVYGGTGRAARDWRSTTPSCEPSPRCRTTRRCSCSPAGPSV